MTLRKLLAVGQSVWLDYIRRDLVRSGELAALIRDQGLRGMTSNPTIFDKAIASGAYDDTIRRHGSRAAPDVFEQIALEDIREAADLLRPVYDEAERDDGFVSIEVSPRLAHDTAGTIEEARRLWRRAERDNVMVKIPATAEGIPAIRQLLGEGININVTLLFSRDVYGQVAEAHLDGLEALLARGGDLRKVSSVASFFVSRVDTAIDRMLQQRGVGTELIGKTAIANAKLAYQDWKARLHAPRWQALALQGARTQRLLWASTSTKDPRLSDLHYVEALIGPQTVDTMPMQTLQAFVDHGRVELSLEMNLDQAHELIATLPRYGISLWHVTEQLLSEGITTFRNSYEQLIATVESKREAVK